MYRRLEAEQLKTQGDEPAPEVICVCTCKSEQAADEEPQPGSNQANVQLAVDFDING